MTNNIQGNSHQAISWFLNRNAISQKGIAWYIWSDEREEPTTKNTLPCKTVIQICWGKQKLSGKAKVKHRKTNFTDSVKGTSLSRKHKTRKRPTENKHKTMKKMVTGSYILLITLRINELSAPTKRHSLAGWMKICALITSAPNSTHIWTYAHISIKLN